MGLCKRALSHHRRRLNLGTRLVLVATLLCAGRAARAQSPGIAERTASHASHTALDSLLNRALLAHPGIRAAESRVEAARAAVGPAGALPDPMLGVGVMNVPLGARDEADMTAMTMKTVGVGQMIPYPGKLALRRRVAELELSAAEAQHEAARLAVAEEVRRAYYELAFLDQAVGIIERNQKLLTNFVRVTESRYGVGTGGQQDVLKARVELARLAEEAVTLAERRTATLARLNAALDRPTGTPVAGPQVPEHLARAAVASNAREIRFASAALGSRAADSPLPPLAELQETAVRQSPAIRAHQAMIEAQAARVELARKEHLPDFDVSVQYGQRNDRPDMVSAMVSVPIPLRKGSKQDLEVKQAEAQLAALQAEHHEQANEIRAEVAGAYADLERNRAQLALFVKSILPQGRAALESATASFQVGRVDFLTVLENQATLYNYETQYHRGLADFAARLAELERTVGGQVLQ